MDYEIPQGGIMEVSVNENSDSTKRNREAKYEKKQLEGLTGGSSPFMMKK